MKLNVKEISEEVNEKANAYIAKMLMNKSDFSVKEIVDMRKAYMAGAISVLECIKDRVGKSKTKEDEKAGSDVKG